MSLKSEAVFERNGGYAWVLLHETGIEPTENMCENLEAFILNKSDGWSLENDDARPDPNKYLNFRRCTFFVKGVLFSASLVIGTYKGPISIPWNATIQADLVELLENMKKVVAYQKEKEKEKEKEKGKEKEKENDGK